MLVFNTLILLLKNTKLCFQYKCLALSLHVATGLDRSFLFTGERRNQTFPTTLLSLSLVPHPWTSQSKMNSLFALFLLRLNYL